MENTEDTLEAEKNKKMSTEEEKDPVQANEESEDNVEELRDKNDGASPDVEEQEDFKEKFYYLAAEMQNLQKRFDREKQNLVKFGNEKILQDMVDIIDNLERTLSFIEKDEDEKVKNIVVGVEMIKNLFLETLAKHGLKQIDALGRDFDPHFHEALAQQPAEGKKEMEIIMVHQNGYTLNDRVIRAAKVIVAKNE